MKKAWIAVFLLGLSFTALTSSVTAYAGQDTRLPATKIADILAQFPANGNAHRDRLAEEILGLGESGITDIARLLVPAGAGNDTAARFALNAMSAYAGQFGIDSKRIAAERSLIRALNTVVHPEVKAFLLSQLRLVGRDDSAKAAEAYLLDASLCEPATQLMLSLANQPARQALAAALPKARDANLITIVKAAGELKVDEANRSILALNTGSGIALRKTVLAALANIASENSYSTLVSAARKVNFGYDPANATGSLLAYARNLGLKGEVANCEKICRLIMKQCQDPGRLATNAAALAILADNRGYEIMPELLRAAENQDKAYRNAVLSVAEKISGIAATRQWIAKAQSARPELRTEIIGMLGRRGDRYALPFLQSSLNATEPDVFLAAAESLASIMGADAAADLLPLLKNRSGDAVPRITDLLMWTVDERHLDPLFAMMDTLAPTAKAGAIAIIASKGGRRFADSIIPLTSDSNLEIRTAAFVALKNLVGAKDLPLLLGLLDSSTEAQLVKEVQQAVVKAAAQVVPSQAGSRQVLDRLKTFTHPERIVAILPQIGGAEALRVVLAQFDAADPDQKATAFRALVQWKDPGAARRLYEICAAGDPKFRDEAFNGFVRQISGSSLPAEQRLLELRRILPIAARMSERRTVIRAMERVKTFSSFMLVARYLDDRELANEAAGVLMRMALPSSGSHDGLSGSAVRNALSRVLQVLSGPESDYDKENIRNYLAAMPKSEGFVPLFNGKDLTGWKGLVENPIARAKMTPEQLAAKQAEADKKAGANWSVRDGMIVFNGSGDNLCSVKEYGDFELLADWRITKDGDSGIYLRGSPQVQIWDPARIDVGAQVGSGGLYNNQKNPSKPLVKADNPVGEWNSLRIIMVGEKVTVFLNGSKVVDDVTLENYWDRKQPIFPTGAIELQAHGTDLAFRDLYVREVSGSEYRLSDEERADGFVALFNGRDLNGWIGNSIGYKVEDGVLVYHPELGNHGNLYTDKEYADFQFRFEFQLSPGSNSGVGVRAPLEGDAAYVGMEIQILDDPAPVYSALQPYQYHGSVYGVIPARRGFLKPTGEWNSEEIIAKGTRVQVILNGTVIVDGDIAEASKNGTLDHQKHPGLQRAAGHIGWLSHDSVVRIRNIRVKIIT